MYQSATGALYLVTELNLLDAAPRDREPEAEVRDYDRRRSPGLEWRNAEPSRKGCRWKRGRDRRRSSPGGGDEGFCASSTPASRRRVIPPSPVPSRHPVKYTRYPIRYFRSLVIWQSADVGCHVSQPVSQSAARAHFNAGVVALRRSARSAGWFILLIRRHIYTHIEIAADLSQDLSAYPARKLIPLDSGLFFIMWHFLVTNEDVIRK